MMFLGKSSLTRSLIAACALTSATASARAEEASGDKLDEVVVTAEKREESLQKVPLSVTALSGENLENLGAYDLNDYFKFVPGLNYAPAASGDRGGQNIVIRGVSNTRLTGVDASASAATTSFYLNEIPVTLIDPELFDISRVEVLKGPQGTLFGAASMGGTIRIIMNEPQSHSYEGRAELQVLGREGGLGERLQAMLNMPLVEGVLAARLVAYERYEDGFIDVIRPPLSDTTQKLAPSIPGYNVLNAQASGTLLRNTNTTQTEGARLALMFTPNDALKLEPTFVYQKIQKGDADTFDANLNDGFVKKRFVPEPQAQSFNLSSLEGSYDFGPAKLVSATGYFQRNYLETADETLGTFVQFGGTGVTNSCPQGNCIAGSGALGTYIHTNSFTQELRVQSTGHSQSELLNRFDWVLGVYYSRERRDGEQLWFIPGFNDDALKPVPAIGDTTIFASNWKALDTNKSEFIDVGLHITSRLKVTAGVRHYDEAEQIARNLIGPLQGAAYATTNDPTFAGSQAKGNTPRYTGSYQITDDILAYVSAAKGFRAGGGIVPVTEPACAPVIEQEHLQAFTSSFGPDKLWNYEVGLKTAWDDRRITVNAAGYDIKWSQLQQGISLAQFFNSACTRSLTANVGNAEIKGGELEIRALAVPNLLLEGTVAYTDAKITGVDPAARVGHLGAPLQNVPKWTATATAEYHFPNLVLESSGYVRADYAYRSDMTTTVGIPANPLLMLPSYSNVNFRFGIDHDRLNAEIYMENAFNSVQLISATPGIAGAVSQVANYPRTVGLRMGYQF
jgi:iron complex outermembrane recepter protein